MLGYIIIAIISAILFASMLTIKPHKSPQGVQVLKERCENLCKEATKAVADIEKSEWL